MDTAERTSVGPSSDAASYDGFISYSHAADDLLAPRLQAGLQRFAKPWWKRRAVRIFRDESSLAANPHLWSSITQALDDSSWFVLLLSEDAASSEWVGKEIQHWIDHKPSDRILPVVTDGTFGWENGHVTGTSVPPALQRVFTEEPRWVDLRFARGEEHLDLQNPDFSAAVADIAATIRGVPKDELASEEVKQHRRTVRTAWAAGIGLAVLAIAAMVAGVFAIGQRNDARDNADLAQQEAQRANQETERANTLAGQEAAARAEADTNAEEATRNAQLATARELAASAVNVLDSDPELSILLTLEAITATPEGQDQPVEVINALWEAASSHRLIGEIEHGYGGPTNIDLSPDGALLAVASADGASVRVYETSDLTMVWEYTEATSDSFARPDFSPDGSLLAVPAVDSESVFTSYVRGEPDELPNRILILDTSTGKSVKTLEFADCVSVDSPTWSPDGSHLTVGVGPPGCPRPEAPGGAWVEVFDAETWESVKLLTLDAPAWDTVQHFDDQGRLFVFGSLHKPRIYSAEDYDLVSELDQLPQWLGAVSPDGSLIAIENSASAGGAGLDLFDSQTGERTDRVAQLLALPHPPKGLTFSPDGRYLVAATEGSFAIVWDVSAGVELLRVPGGPSNSAAIDSSRDLLYTGHPDGTVRVWNLGPSTVGRTVVGDLGDAPFINSNSFRFGPDLGAALAVDRRSSRAYMQLFELSTGELVDDRIEVAGVDPIVALESGEFVYSRPETGEVSTNLWIKYDPNTAAAESFGGCPFLSPTNACSENGEVLEYFDLVRSIDGSEVAVIDGGGQWAVLDQTTGAVIGREEHPRGNEFVLAFGADWYLLDAGEVTKVVDRRSGEELWTGDVFARRNEPAPSATRIALTDSAETLVILDIGTWEAQWLELGFGRIRALSFGPDERLFAVGDAETLHIVDLEQGIILQTVPIPGVSDVHWFDDQHVLIGTSDGVWATLSLDVDDLIASATDSIFRAFSAQECFTYRIDPCPKLDEIQSR